MRPEQIAAGKIERVMQCTSRMVLGDIQRREIVIIVLDFGAGSDAKPRVPENLLDANRRTRYGMPATQCQASSGQCNVNFVGRKLAR